MALAYGLLILVGLIGAAIVVLAVPALIGYMIYDTVTGARRDTEESVNAEETSASPELKELSVA